MSFSSQLKKLMTERDIKAVALAKAANLSEASISDYLNGKKEPRGRQSLAISRALNVSLDVLWDTEFQEKDFSKQTTENIKDDDIPIVIAASSGYYVDADKKEEEYTEFKQKIVREVYRARLDMRQMRELYEIIRIFDANN